MDRALWLLLRLRLYGWWRRLMRYARTVRGVLLLVVGGLFFGCIFVNPLVQFFLDPPGTERAAELRGQVDRFGPLLLVVYCLSTLVFSTAERGITFTAAEVDLLFPAPFSRRQLLAFKILMALFGTLVTAVFLTAVSLSYGVWPLAAFVGVTLALLFLNLFTMAVGLVATVLGAVAYSRARRIVLAAVLAVAVLGLLHVGGEVARLEPQEIAARVEQSPALQVLLAPFTWFTRTITAQNLWPDLLRFAALGLLVDAVLLALVFGLDAHFLEASAASSEKHYARLQRARGGGALITARGSALEARVRLPMLPFWGGVGPVAWRQLTTALRSLRGLVTFLVIFVGLMLAPLLFGSETRSLREAAPGWALAMPVLMITFFALPSMILFDFRGDVDRMDVLKALPVPPFFLVLGQLATPVLLLSALQLGLVTAVQVLFGGVEQLLLGVAVLALPFNFLVFGVENLLYLWFPSRVAPATPGDLQQMGRQMLVLLGKVVVLGLAGSAAALAGVAVFLVSGQSLPAALAAVGVVLAAGGVALVPLLALAFRNFDVARDTPP